MFSQKLKTSAVVALVVASLTSLGLADTTTLDGTNLAANGGTFAVNNGSAFLVDSTGLTDFTGGAVAWASPSNNTNFPGEILLLTEPPAGGYRDAGMVLFFNNPVALNTFVSAQVNFLPGTTNTPLQSNLWLDTSGNGSLFSFNTVGGEGTYQGLNGDTVIDGGSNVVNGLIDGNTDFNGHTLSEYADGDVAGVDGNTKFALWIGVSGGSFAEDAIDNVVVNTVPTSGAPAPTPLPSAANMGLGMLAVIGAAGMLRKKLRTA